MSIWQCQYKDTNGVQCANVATKRLQYSSSHPFDHMDVCAQHLKEFSYYRYSESIDDSTRQKTT